MLLNEMAEKEMRRCCPDCGTVPGHTSMGQWFSLMRLNNECECCKGAADIKSLGSPNKVAMDWGKHVDEKIHNRKDRLIYISAAELYSHPDNPRKEIRDIEELTESVRVKGVMQNLTVVKGHYLTPAEIKKLEAETDLSSEMKKNLEKGWMPDGYTVIIGHRRLEAAKGAGLKVLPCRIAEMDYREQLTVMLMENVQRNDLTVYEQAKGFQLLLDLGDTVEGIAEKSGFSQTTVRKRIKLAELDEEKLKKASERQLSLFDLEQLNRVEDIQLRNKLLDDIGTSNFNYAIRRALDDQERAKNNAKWRKFFLDKGLKEIDYGHCWNYTPCDTNYLQFVELNEKEEVKLNGDEQYFAINYGAVYFRKDKVEKEISEAEKEERRKRAKRREVEDKLDEATKRAFWLRRAFVFSVSENAARDNIGTIVEFLMKKEWTEEGKGGYYMRYICGEFTKEGGEKNVKYEEIKKTVEKNPYQSLLRHAYVLWADSRDVSYCAYYGHSENKRLDYIYDVLCRLGYEMSDEEKQLQDGTHKLFKVFEEE